MNRKLEAKLVEKYPILYDQYGGDISQTCMGWGMSCGDGWFKLIDELSGKLEQYRVVAAQVKEKFGGLRFYLESCDSEIYDIVNELINNAEHKSYEICETCGSPGSLRRGGWMTTACDKCQKLFEKGKTPIDNPEEFELPLTE